MTQSAVALEQQRTELKACIAASEMQLSILSAQKDLAFGAVAAEVAAMARNQAKLAEIEDRLALLAKRDQHRPAA